MLLALLVVAVGVALVGAGSDALHSFAVVLLGLVLFGCGNGAVDVMMNVEGAAIEKYTGRTILPLFHAFFSFGTVIGAGLGVFAAAAGVQLFTHAGLPSGAITLVALLHVAHVPPPAQTEDPAAAEGQNHDRC